MHSSFGKKQSG